MRKLVLMFMVVSFLAAGCTTPGKKTATGAVIGAGAGAGAGALIGGKKGALIGAAAGAVIGGTIGNRLDKQAKELAAVAETRRTEEGILVNMKGDILFATGKAILQPAAVEQLNQVGDILAKYQEDRIVIIGHTDSVGDDAYNQRLSENRAMAVKTQLMSRGVPSANIVTTGMGESQPIASNTTAEGRQQNRRVEMQITIPESK